MRNRPLVIVRAWGDEPVVLSLYRIENNRCYVALEGSLRPLSLPADQVFVHSQALFSTLNEAYSTGKTAELRAIYEAISLDDFACNKYKDNIESPHDQEDITNSERASSGHDQ